MTTTEVEAELSALKTVLQTLQNLDPAVRMRVLRAAEIFSSGPQLSPPQPPIRGN